VIPGLPVGNCLGQLTDELGQGDAIVDFCSTGPKAYAYNTRNNKKVVKAKGIPTGSAGVHYELYKKLVTSEEKIKFSVEIPLIFKANKAASEINRRTMMKTVQLTYDKRIVLDNYRTRPFGTKDV
jgi:hypothetical protein